MVVRGWNLGERSLHILAGWVVVVLASLAASFLFLCIQYKKLMKNITCATS